MMPRPKLLTPFSFSTFLAHLTWLGRDMTTEEIATRVGVTPNCIRRWMTGDLTEDNADRVCTRMDIAPQDVWDDWFSFGNL